MSEKRLEKGTKGDQNRLVFGGSRRFLSSSRLLNLVTRVSNLNISNSFYINLISKLFIYSILSYSFLFKLVYRRILPFIGNRLLSRSQLSIKSILVYESLPDALVMFINLKLSETGPLPCLIMVENKVQLGYVDGEGTVVNFGVTTLPPFQVVNSLYNQLGFKLQVKITSQENFVQFATQLLNTTSLRISLQAQVSAYAFNLFPIQNLSLNKRSEIEGMNKLESIQILKVKVIEGTTDSIKMEILCCIVNPSQVEVNLGDTTFHLIYNGSVVGSVLIKDMKLSAGRNLLPTLGTFHLPPDATQTTIEHGNLLLSNFCSGIASQVTVSGNHPLVSDLEYWRLALSSLNLTCSLAGIETPLIHQVNLSLNIVDSLTSLFQKAIPAKLTLSHPFQCPVSLLKLDATAEMENQNIGSVNLDLSLDPIILPPNQIVTSRAINMKLNLDPTSLKKVLDKFAKGDLKFEVKAKIFAKLGEYRVDLNYTQIDIPIYLGGI